MLFLILRGNSSSFSTIESEIFLWSCLYGLKPNTSHGWISPVVCFGILIILTGVFSGEHEWFSFDYFNDMRHIFCVVSSDFFWKQKGVKRNMRKCSRLKLTTLTDTFVVAVTILVIGSAIEASIWVKEHYALFVNRRTYLLSEPPLQHRFCALTGLCSNDHKVGSLESEKLFSTALL